MRYKGHSIVNTKTKNGYVARVFVREVNAREVFRSAERTFRGQSMNDAIDYIDLAVRLPK